MQRAADSSSPLLVTSSSTSFLIRAMGTKFARTIFDPKSQVRSSPLLFYHELSQDLAKSGPNSSAFEAAESMLAAVHRDGDGEQPRA